MINRNYSLLAILYIVINTLVISGAIAQSVQQLVTDEERIYYATLSSDESLLGIQTIDENIIVFDKKSLKQRFRTKMVRPAEVLSYRTGKKTFHFTEGNELLFLDSHIDSDSLKLFLVKSTIDERVDSLKILALHKSRFFEPEQMQKMKWDYSLDANDSYLILSMNRSIYYFSFKEKLSLRKQQEVEVPIEGIAISKSKVAWLSNDTITVSSLESDTFLKKIPDSTASSLTFLNDHQLIIASKGITKTIDLKADKFIIGDQNPYSSTNGIQVKDSVYSFSGHNLGFANKTYGALYKNKELIAIQYLPKNTGSIDLFVSSSNELWTILAEGKVFKLSLNQTPPMPILQVGHRNGIKNFAVSKDKQSLLTTSDDRSIILWDIHNGTVVNRFETDESLLDKAFFAADDKDIYYTISDRYNKKIHTQIPSNFRWGLPYNVYLQDTDEKYLDSIKSVETSYEQSLASLKRRYDIEDDFPAASSPAYFAGIIEEEYVRKLRIVSLSNREVKDVALPDSLTWYNSTMTFYDNKTLLLQGRGSTILLYDCQNLRTLRRLGSIPEKAGWLAGIQKMILSPSGDTLFTVHNNTVIQGWNLRKAERFYYFNQKKFNVAQGKVMDYKNGKLSLTIVNNNLQLQSVVDLYSDSVKIVYYADSTFTIRQQKVIFKCIKEKGIVSSAKLSATGDSLLVMRSYYPPGFNAKEGGIEVYIDLWDLRTMEPIHQAKVGDFKTLPVWEASGKFEEIFIWDYNASSKHMQKDMSEGLGGYGTSPYVYVISLPEKKVKKYSMDKLAIERLGPNDVLIRGDEIWLRDDFKSTITRVRKNNWKVIDKKTGTSEEYGRLRAPFIVDENDNMLFAQTQATFNSSTTLEAFSVRNNLFEHVSYTDGVDIQSLSNIADNNTFAVGLRDHSISIRSSLNLEEKYRIILNEKKDYLFLSPEGYYKADRNSSSSLFFNWRNETYSFEQFDLWFNRPDLVLGRTGFYDAESQSILDKAYRKRVHEYNIQPLDSFLTLDLPQLTVLNDRDIPLQTTSEVLSINLKWQSKVPSESLEIKVNGITTQHIALANDRSEQQVEIKLSSGENRISIRLRNKNGLYSLPKEVKTDYLNNSANAKIHLITIAVSEYQNDKLNLTYPVKDAKDIISVFKGAHQTVVVDTLFNEQVQRDNILQIKEKLKQTDIDDKVILFLAGHGMLDDNFDFRFATYTIDQNDPNKGGILYEEIENLVNDIPARNRLILIDACHSGKVDKDEILKTGEQYISQRGIKIKKQTFTNVHKNLFKHHLIDPRGFELMEELFYDVGSASGAEVVVAAAGNSYALESDKWQNGVFTYSFINGIVSRTADLNKDRKITIDEIVEHLQGEVETLTDGDQKPRFRSENRVNTYVIWEY